MADDGAHGLIRRRDFLKLAVTAAAGSGLALSTAHRRARAADWRDLLGDYDAGTRHNIVAANGRRALLSSELYPGTYIRDALFWGPLALNDPGLGMDCYQWFSESQMSTGQIRSAVPIFPEEAGLLTPEDDEGTLLFLIASDWLRRAGFGYDPTRILAAWEWVKPHVSSHLYFSPSGPFRYWADTIDLDTADSIAYNQGLYCLSLRALRSIGLGAVTESDVAAAQSFYRNFYNGNYIPLGKFSRFARALDMSAIFPEFLSRYLYGEPILPDTVVIQHVSRGITHGGVRSADGRLLGIKTICHGNGNFFAQDWFFAPGLNPPGDYQNGGHWPMYNLVALALAYQITRDDAYVQIIGDLVTLELSSDHQSKEVMRLGPGQEGTFDPLRVNYTWNGLIHAALVWAGAA